MRKNAQEKICCPEFHIIQSPSSRLIGIYKRLREKQEWRAMLSEMIRHVSRSRPRLFLFSPVNYFKRIGRAGWVQHTCLKFWPCSEHWAMSQTSPSNDTCSSPITSLLREHIGACRAFAYPSIYRTDILRGIHYLILLIACSSFLQLHYDIICVLHMSGTRVAPIAQR